MAPRQPREIHEEFERRFLAGDLDGIVELYEPGAIFVAEDGQISRGRDAIREVLGAFLALRPRYSQEIERVVEAEGVALLTTSWTIEGTGKDGRPIRQSGRTADVARRQTDGSWRASIDSPFGGGA